MTRSSTLLAIFSCLGALAAPGRARAATRAANQDAGRSARTAAWKTIGGQAEIVQKIREIVDWPILHREIFEHNPSPPSGGILLVGPPGNGKTKIARAIAETMGEGRFFQVDGPELKKGIVGDSAKALRKLFDDADKAAAEGQRVVIFFDEIDAFAKARGGLGETGSEDLLTQLLTLMDGTVQRNPNVVLIAATNRPDVLDPALRRKGRFETELAVNAPTPAGRKEILEIHAAGLALGPDVDLDEVAEGAHGFSGADLEKLAGDASLIANRRAVLAKEQILAQGQSHPDVDALTGRALYVHHGEPLGEKTDRLTLQDLTKIGHVTGLALDPPRPTGARQGTVKRSFTVASPAHGIVPVSYAPIQDPRFKLVTNGKAPLYAYSAAHKSYIPVVQPAEATAVRPAITQADLLAARATIVPTSLRTRRTSRPNVRWDEIAGQEQAKAELRAAVELPLEHPDTYAHYRSKPPTGVLLVGPKGTGKTLLAQAAATATGANFIEVKASDLLSSMYGASGDNVTKLFKELRASAPTILFIDEIETLFAQRDAQTHEETKRVVTAFLQELNGLGAIDGVTLIAATNYPDQIDSAFLRTGRFDSVVYVGLPDVTERLAALEIHTRGRPMAADVSLEWLAEETNRFSGADLKGLVERAAGIARSAELAGNNPGREITKAHFEAALQRQRPSVSEADEARYAAYRNQP